MKIESTKPQKKNVAHRGELIALAQFLVRGWNATGLCSACQTNKNPKYFSIVDPHEVNAMVKVLKLSISRTCAPFWEMGKNICKSVIQRCSTWRPSKCSENGEWLRHIITWHTNKTPWPSRILDTFALRARHYTEATHFFHTSRIFWQYLVWNRPKLQRKTMTQRLANCRRA